MAATALLLIAAVALLVSPALAQNCDSHRFPSNTTYANCTNLPTLQAFLHWTYNPAATPRPTLSIAFTAPPPSADGWVSWALNPTGPFMVGSQALIAFRDTNGSVVARTYNITVKGPVTESRISYEVLSKSAVAADGLMTIFATFPWTETGRVFQVWQVGALVRGGVPQVHAFAPDNLNAGAPLEVGISSTTPAQGPGRGPIPAPGPAPARAPTPSSIPATPPSPSAGQSVAKLGGGLLLALLGASTLLL